MIVFYDYTCGDSHRLKLLLDQVGINPEWRTFSLKENKLEEGDSSLFEADEIESISVLALALAHAARESDFDRYHSEVFEAFHQEDHHVTPDELFSLAGIKAAEFKRRQRDLAAKLAAEHRHAAQDLGVYGTPTVVLEDGSAFYVELEQVVKDVTG